MEEMDLTGEVLINLFHFQNNIIWDTGFSQQHVELTRHAASDRVNTKPVGGKNADTIVGKPC